MKAHRLRAAMCVLGIVTTGLVAAGPPAHANHLDCRDQGIPVGDTITSGTLGSLQFEVRGGIDTGVFILYTAPDGSGISVQVSADLERPAVCYRSFGGNLLSTSDDTTHSLVVHTYDPRPETPGFTVWIEDDSSGTGGAQTTVLADTGFELTPNCLWVDGANLFGSDCPTLPARP